MSDHRRTLWQLAGLMALGVAGLMLMVDALERRSLVGFAEAAGQPAETPMRVYVALFAGFAVVNLGVYFAHRVWGRYVREHPEVRQLPLWFPVTLMIVGVLALTFGMVGHAGWVRSQTPVPLEPDQGFLAYAIVMLTAILIAGVLLAVRRSITPRST